MKHRRVSTGIAVALVAAGAVLAAQERPDEDVFWQIRREGTSRSQIMQTLHVLTDVHGPRLTGSPSLEAAGRWAVDQMERWGLVNGRLEPWEFGHQGWTNERLSAHIVSPVQDPLVAEVLAWTPGTTGVARARAVQLTLPDRATRDELTAHLDGLADAVRGRIVLVGPPADVPVTINAGPLRHEDAAVLAQMNAPPPAAPATSGRRRGRRRAWTGRAEAAPAAHRSRARGAAQRVPRRAGRVRAGRRRGARSRPDPRVPQPHLRRGQGASHRGAAQRGLRADLAPDGRRSPGRARVRDRQPHPSRGADRVQRDRRDSRRRPGRRGGDARGAPRLVARRHGRHRQRHRVRRDDGGGPDPDRHRRPAATDDPRRAVERRGAGPAGIAGVRAGALRHRGGAEGRLREARRLLQHRHRNGTRARPHRVRSPRGGYGAARGDRAARRSRPPGREHDAQQAGLEHGLVLLRRGGPAGDQYTAGSDRVPDLYVAHEPRHLRARHRGRRHAVGGRAGRGGLPPGHARRRAAALPGGRDAGRAGGELTSGDGVGSPGTGATLRVRFGDIDIYLFDQILRGRFDARRRVLDVGCGDGRNLIFFLQHGFDCHAVDSQPAAVEAIRAAATALAPHLPPGNFRLGEAERLPHADGSMDAVICCAVLHFAADASHFDRMVAELWRVLAPGGLLFARLASNIGLESTVGPAGRQVRLPDGTDRFVVDEATLLGWTGRLGGRLADPIKTTNVQGRRAMTTWCVVKERSRL